MLTTARRINLTQRFRTDAASDITNYLVSRLIDEAQANRAEDHWHPEIAAPLQEMADAWIEAMAEAGVEYEWSPAD